MATLRLVNNVFSDEINNSEIKAGTSVENLVKAYAQSSDYNSTLVECYDADTGKTFYATLEDTDEAAIHAVVTVNSEDTTLDYVIKEDDFVTLMFLPASKSQGLGALFGGIAGAITGGWIGTMICPGFGTIIGAAIGLAVGAIVGLIVGPYLTPDMSSDNQKKLTAKTKDITSLPDVRGSQNQPILGNPIPFVLGKHLTTPFIAGSPYNIIKGVYGDTNEIHALYIVGYGPLALTDFKLGDRLLAYNRANPNDTDAGTVFTGALTKETGDILNVWDTNDIELEILQQNPFSDEINYGELYPYARIQQDVKANIIYIKDGSEPTVNYKGASLANGTRTNSIRFTNPYPASASVELDFPSGLYNTWSQSLDGNTVQNYQSMPLWLAIEWRPYMETNPESDPSKSDNNNELNYWKTDKATWDNNKENLPLTRPWMSFAQISSNEKYFYTNATARMSADVTYLAHQQLVTPTVRWNQIAIQGMSNIVDFTLNFTTATKEEHNVKIFYKTSIVHQADWIADAPWGDLPLNSVSHTVYSKTSTIEQTTQSGITSIVLENADSFDVPLSTDVIISPLYFSWGGQKFTTHAVSNINVVVEVTGFYVDGVNCTSSKNIDTEYGFAEDTDWDLSNKKTNHYTLDIVATEKKPIKSNTYTSVARTADINAHVGNDLGTASDYNPNWINKTAFDLSGLGASSIKDSSINEFRAVADIDFEQWARANFSYSTEEEFIEKYKAYFFPVGNTINAVEVRVVRITANYLNTTGTTNITYEGHTYQKGSTTFNDHFTWDTLSSEMFDSKKLDSGLFVRKRPLRDDIYKKCCIVALKAKVDNLENLSSTLEKFTCEAQAFAPTFDEETSSWLPESVLPVVKYYKPNTQEIITVGSKTIVNSGHGEEITEEQYLEDRQNGIKSIKQKNGNDFYEQMALQIWHSDYFDSYKRLVIPKDSYVRKLLENNVASSILLAGIGSHLGIHALSYEDFDLHSLGELFTFCKSVKDGSIYKETGYHYDHDGNRVLHEAGDEVETYYTANAYIYNTIKMEDLFSKLAVAGRSVYTRKGMNKLTFIIDKPEDYPVGLINQMNTLSSSSVISYKDLPAGITISFNDENDGYRKNTVDIFKDGEKEEDYRGSLESYNIDYVTNPYQLYSLGRYVLANRILNREVLYRRVGAEGATFSLGSLVVVSDPQIMIGTDLGGRITKILEDEDYIYGFVINSTYNYTGNTQGVIINQPLQLGASRVLKVQLKDPCSLILDGIEYVLQKGQTNLVIFNQAWAKNTYDTIHIAPQIDNSVSFGLYSEDLVLYRIIGIKSTENFQYDLTLVKYQEGLYHSGITLPTFQLNSTPQPFSADAFGANTAITMDDLYKERVATQQTIIDQAAKAVAMEDNDNVDNPDPVTNLSATLKEDSIVVKWSVPSGSGISNSTKQFFIELSTDDEETWTEIGSVGTNLFEYELDRDIYGYPESTYFDDWVIRVRVRNVYNKYSTYVSTDLTTTGYKTWEASKPSNVKAVASKDAIVLTWDKGVTDDYGTKVYAVYKNNVLVADNITGTTYVYTIDRVNDGFPEASSFANQNWNFTIHAKNESVATVPNNETSSDAAVYDTSSYGTWLFTSAPNVNAKVTDRTVMITASLPERSDQKEIYGNIRYKVRIRRGELTYNIGSTTQTVNADTEWHCPATYADYLASSDNYKDSTKDNLIEKNRFVEMSGTYVQTMPLYGQETQNIHNTPYYFDIKAFNEAGESDWYSGSDVYANASGTHANGFLATALATSIADVVHANEHVKESFVEKLSAISANVGVIQKGGFGSFASQTNYWALSTLSAQDAGTSEKVYEGSFRVGGQNEYLKVEPVVNSSGQIIDYTISMKAGNIEFSNSISDANSGNGTFLYNDERTIRLRLTYQGMTFQNYDSVNQEWVDSASISVEKNGSLIVTNGDDTPEICVEYPSANSVVYHLDSNATYQHDQNGTNSENLSFQGSVNQIEALIGSACFHGTIKKELSGLTDKDMLFCTKATGIEVSDTVLFIDGTEDDTISTLDNAKSTDWGLTSEQVSSNIFKWGE